MFIGTFKLLAGTFKEKDSLNLIPMSLAIMAFSASMLVLSASIAILGHLNLANLVKGLIAVAVVLGMFIGAFKLLSIAFKGVESVKLLPIAIALGVFAASLLAIVGAIAILSAIPLDNILQSLLALALALGGIIAFAFLLQNIHVEMAAIQIIALAGALLLCSVALNILQNIDYVKTAIGLALVLASMVAMAGIGTLANAAVPGLLALSAVFLAVGSGALMMGEGINLGAQGLDLLSKINYKNIVNGFALIASHAKELYEAAVALTTVGLAGIISGFGAACQGVGDAIKGVGTAIKGLGEAANKITNGAGDLIGGILSGLGDAAKSAGINSLADSVERLAKAYKNLEKVNKNINQFTNNIKDFYNKGLEAGKNYLKGIQNGLSDKSLLSSLENKAYDLGNSISDSFNKSLGIESPSKVGKDSGGWYVIGINNGIEEKKYITEETAKKMGVDINNTVERFLNKDEGARISGNYIDGINDKLDELDNKKITIDVEFIEKYKKSGGNAVNDLLNNNISPSQPGYIKSTLEKIVKDKEEEYSSHANILSKNYKIDSGLTSTTKTNKKESGGSKEKTPEEIHKEFLKNYKDNIKTEQKIVKYYANEKEKQYEKEQKALGNHYESTIELQQYFTATSQNELNTQLDQMAVYYAQSDADFNDYLSNLDKNISAEDKLYAMRLETLKKFVDEAETTNSGMNWGNIDVTKKFEQGASELKPHEARQNLQSYLDAYKVFKEDMTRMAGTNISNQFLSKLYNDGPNGDMFLAAKNMSDSELELFGATWDEIHGLNKNGDSEFLLGLQMNRAQIQASHIRQEIRGIGPGDKSNIVYSQVKDRNNALFEQIKKAKDEDKREELIQKLAGDDEDYADYIRDLVTESETPDENDFDPYKNEKNLINQATQSREELEQQIVDLNKGLTSSATIYGSSSTQDAYNTGFNQVTAISEGMNAALPTLQQSILMLQQSTASLQPSTTTQEDTTLLGQVTDLQNRMMTAEAAIQQVITSILTVINGMVSEGAGSLFEQQGMMVDAGIANGIINNIGTVTNATTNMCKAAIEAAKLALGIASPSKEFYSIGEYIIEGLCNAIADGESAVTNAMVSEVLAKMEEAAEDEEDINSPSKKWYRFGEFIDQGLANGITDNVSKPMNALSELVSSISEDMENEDNYNPVITPVIDLSQAEKQSKGINTLFANSQALEISANISKAKLSQNRGNSDSSSNQGKTINFTQNNYSPKALSREEIYRQTRNQFSQIANAN